MMVRYVFNVVSVHTYYLFTCIESPIFLARVILYYESSISFKEHSATSEINSVNNKKTNGASNLVYNVVYTPHTEHTQMAE